MVGPGRSRVLALSAALLLGLTIPGLGAGLAQTGEAPITLRIQADTWCPYNCDPESDKPGFMIELAREALAPHGYVIAYSNAPWARAVALALEGAIDGVVGANSVDGAGLLLHQEPFGYSRTTLIVRAEDRFTYMTPEDLGTRRVGVIRGYSYGEQLDAHLAMRGSIRDMVQTVSGDDALIQNIEKLLAGRIDVVLEDETVARYTVSELGLAARVALITADRPDSLFFGFNPDTPQGAEVARLLDEGMRAMRADGRLAAILARYGLAVWN